MQLRNNRFMPNKGHGMNLVRFRNKERETTCQDVICVFIDQSAHSTFFFAFKSYNPPQITPIA